MKYNYQARTRGGQVQAGIIEASSQETAIETLKSRDLFVTAIEEFASPIYAQKIKFFERITRKEIVIFSRQLAIMFKARVPLVEVFKTFHKQTKNAAFREVILKIADEVEGGSTLSAALAMHPKLFSSFYVSMVRSGEATGKLTEVFLYLADFLEKDSYFRGKIIGAMVYPGFIFGVFVIVFTIIVTYVIPQLAEVLKESGQGLPWITLAAIGISDFFVHYWWVAILVIVALIVGVIGAFRTTWGKEWFDKNVLRVPLIGQFMQKLYLSRFALNLSTLISGGLSIVQGLEITADVVGNTTYKKIIFSVRDGVKKGEAMSTVLQNYPNTVSPLFHQMVVVGEKTGTLDTSLNNVVDFYQKDIERSLDDLIKLIEPIFIILLGLVVGGLVGAVLLPLYSGLSNF